MRQANPAMSTSSLPWFSHDSLDGPLTSSVMIRLAPLSLLCPHLLSVVPIWLLMLVPLKVCWVRSKPTIHLLGSLPQLVSTRCIRMQRKLTSKPTQCPPKWLLNHLAILQNASWWAAQIWCPFSKKVLASSVMSPSSKNRQLTQWVAQSARISHTVSFLWTWMIQRFFWVVSWHLSTNSSSKIRTRIWRSMYTHALQQPQNACSKSARRWK